MIDMTEETMNILGIRTRLVDGDEVTEAKINDVWVDIASTNLKKVYCPSCGVFVGFHDANIDTSKIKEIVFEKRNKVVGSMSAKDIENYKPRCSTCGAELGLLPVFDDMTEIIKQAHATEIASLKEFEDERRKSKETW